MEASILYLKTLTDAIDLGLTEDQLGQFEIYAKCLVEWNEKMNLTAITDPEGIAVKHFYDSLLLFTAYDIPQGASVIDVGTGAGFPGVVLKIARPDIRLTLLDSLGKRLIFLDALLAELGLDGTTVHARAEEGARGALREQFDLATARAVAALPTLCEYCLPYVRVGGAFAALKGASAAEETAAAENAVKILGGDTPVLTETALPGGDARGIVVIRKKTATPPKYPRPGAKIAKDPLG